VSAEGEVRETCTQCGAVVKTWQRPAVTVDVLVQVGGKLVLVYRRNEPINWALPGGYVDYGERLDLAARREVLEETNLELVSLEQFHTYSAPDRDARQHSISTVFLGRAEGEPKAGDDAEQVALMALDEIPHPLAFDHTQMVRDLEVYLRTGRRPG